MVGPRDNQIDWGAVVEEIEQAQLDTASRGTVPDDDPFGLWLFSLGGVVMLIPRSVVSEGVGGYIGCLQGRFYQVCFADPGSRCGGDGYGDEVARVLEGTDEWVDVWGETLRGWPIVVNYQDMHVVYRESRMSIYRAWRRVKSSGDEVGFPPAVSSLSVIANLFRFRVRGPHRIYRVGFDG